MWCLPTSPKAKNHSRSEHHCQRHHLLPARANIVPKQKSTALAVLFCLRRVDKKDANYSLLFLSCFLSLICFKKIKNKTMAANTSSIEQTLKANGISMNKSKRFIIQLSNKHNVAISGITLTFFISPPPFWVYYSTLPRGLQEKMKHSLREYEAEALRLPRSTRYARVKRSAH